MVQLAHSQDAIMETQTGGHGGDERYPKMDDVTLKGVVEQEIANAEYTSINDIKVAMDYYMARPRGDEIPGRSTIQSRDVADMVEALTADVMAILQDPNMVTFEAVSPEDEMQASVESRMVNHIITTKNKGYILIQQLVKDALMFRNCIAKAFKETKIRVYTDEFDGPVSMEQAQQFQQTLPPNIELVFNPEQPTFLKQVVTTERMQIDPVPTEEFLHTPSWTQVTLEECPFTCHHRELRRYELLEYGFDHDLVFSLNRSKAHLNQNENLREDEDTSQSSTKSLDPIDYYECYLRVDYDGDGFAEMRRIIMASDVIIENVEVRYNAFAGGTAITMPHRWKGQSVYDRLFDVQDAKTGILRQWMDNMNAMNNRRLEAEMKQILEPNELLESRPGGVIKVRKIGSVQPIPVDDIGPSCASALSYWDSIRTNRSGASLDMHSEHIQINDSTAHGVERLVSSKEMVAAMNAKTLAETALRSLYVLVHKVLKHEFGGQPMSAKVGDSWITTDPDVWLERDEACVTIGMSQGENQKRMQALENVYMKQLQLKEIGSEGILVTDMSIYQTLTEQTKAAGLPFPEKYWQSPQSQQAQQTLQQRQQKMQEQEDRQKKFEDLEAQLAIANQKLEQGKSDGQNQVAILKEQLARAKTAAEAAEKDENLKFDYTKHYDDLALAVATLEQQYEITELQVKTSKPDGD